MQSKSRFPIFNITDWISYYDIMQVLFLHKKEAQTEHDKSKISVNIEQRKNFFLLSNGKNIFEQFFLSGE